MRHPLSTSGSGGVSEGSVAVGDVHGFVVEHVLGQAVPEHFDPAVAEGAERLKRNDTRPEQTVIRHSVRDDDSRF